MPSDVTIFAATYAVYIEALLAAGVLAVLLYRQPRFAILRWAAAATVMVIVSYLAAQVAGAIYNDPRPFAVEHFHPLIAHAADNGFPSDHALLAAALVAAVALARPLWAAPFLVLAVIVEAGRVGVGIHHVVDVLGSDGLILLGAMAGALLAPRLATWALPHVPPWVWDPIAAPAEEERIEAGAVPLRRRTGS